MKIHLSCWIAFFCLSLPAQSQEANGSDTEPQSFQEYILQEGFGTWLEVIGENPAMADRKAIVLEALSDAATEKILAAQAENQASKDTADNCTQAPESTECRFQELLEEQE